MGIASKEDLKFYISADLMMNRGYFRCSAKKKLVNLLFPDRIMDYLKVLRKTEYYINTGKTRSLGYGLARARLSSLGMKLGFSIAPNVFGYGLVIPHYGTVVVGAGNHIGNFAVLHTSTCITAGQKTIGDGLYLSTGGKIIGDITLGDNISVAANGVVNKSFADANQLLVGVPASVKREQPVWYIKDGEKYHSRVEKINARAGKR